MKRDISEFRGKVFDVAIIGGGIYGVTAAWDAALRGLRVALVEKGDFGGATSSNSLKIIHGGLRYLQHADFKRMRESIAERRILMHIAPHFVNPLPCVMPTYGHALKGKEVMSIALYLNDLVGYDRNGLADPGKFMPNGHLVTKDQMKQIVPGIEETNLNGGAVWYDCQVHNSERLLMSFLRSAVSRGAVAANYLEMTHFNIEDSRVKGIAVCDVLSGEKFDIAAKVVINNSGPWYNDIVSRLNGNSPVKKVQLSAAMNLVVRKKLFQKYAVGISSKRQFKDDDALINKGSRLFFVTPWKNWSLIGTTHVHHEGSIDDFNVTEADIQIFLDEMNAAYPPANLKREDVLYHYAGLLPMESENPKTGDVKLLKSFQIIDHATENGLEGLLSIISVKYTTARDVAEKTIDQACRKLQKELKSASRSTVLFGGQISHLEEYLYKEATRSKAGLSEATIAHLVQNYGSEYQRVVRYLEERKMMREPVSQESSVLKAEIIHAVREEMAMRLQDVIRRRTDLGNGAYPGDRITKNVGKVMQKELGWDKVQLEQEIDETRNLYSPKDLRS